MTFCTFLVVVSNTAGRRDTTFGGTEDNVGADVFRDGTVS